MPGSAPATTRAKPAKYEKGSTAYSIERLFAVDMGVAKNIILKTEAFKIANRNDVKAAHLKRDMNNLPILDGGGIQNGLNTLQEMSRDPQAAHAAQAAQAYKVYGDEHKPIAAKARDTLATRDMNVKDHCEKDIPELRERNEYLIDILNKSDNPKLAAGSQPIMGQVKEDEAALQSTESEFKRTENNATQIQRQLITLRDKMSRDPLLAGKGTFRRESDQEQARQGIQSHSSQGGR